MTIKSEFILKKFGDPVTGAEEGLDVSILKTCAQIATEAKTLAPVAKKHGGKLRNSITYSTFLQPGDLPEKPKKREGYVGSMLDYAVYQEFGTRKMRPQPFLRPAIALVSGKNLQDVANDINNAMNKWVKGRVTITEF